MWNYITNVPSILKNKSEKEQKAGIQAGNRALAEGKSQTQALLIASLAAKSASAPERKPEDVQKQSISQSFLPANSITADSTRSLVSLEFDKQSRLVATFSDGKTIKTKPVETVINVEQYVTAVGKSVIEGGSTPPQDIEVVIVSEDYDVLEKDDIIIATEELTIFLQDASNTNKTIRIKRNSVDGNTTIQPFEDQTIDGLDDLVLNQNFFSVDLHPVMNNWIIL